MPVLIGTLEPAPVVTPTRVVLVDRVGSLGNKESFPGQSDRAFAAGEIVETDLYAQWIRPEPLSRPAPPHR